MSDPRHTPPPWEMLPNGVIVSHFRNEAKAIGIFQGFASEQSHADEHPFNCRLIVSSPVLYAMVSAFVDAGTAPESLLDDARRVIAEISGVSGV